MEKVDIKVANFSLMQIKLENIFVTNDNKNWSDTKVILTNKFLII